MPVNDSRTLLRLARFRRLIALNTPRLARGNAWQAGNVKSPRELYNHLEKYIVGQEKAKRVLSVAVFNHYQRIRSLSPPSQMGSSTATAGPSRTTKEPPPPPPTSLHASLASTSSHIPRTDPPLVASTSRYGLDPTRAGIRVGETDYAGRDMGDPTIVHSVTRGWRRGDWEEDEVDREEMDVREEVWPREGYFNSRPPPLILPRDYTTSRKRGRPARAQAGSARSVDAEDVGDRVRGRERARISELREDEATATSDRRKDTDEPEGQESREPVEIEKSNVLMIGPTGTGKTLMTKTLAKILDVPFATCDATTYTSAGYVGEDVESCVLRLLQAADYDVARTEVGIIHIDEIDKLARRGAGDPYGFATWGGGRDVGGEGVQQAFLRLLEGTTVSLNAKPPPVATGGTGRDGEGESGSGPAGGRGGLGQGKKGVREGLPGFGTGGGSGATGKGETFMVDTSNILFICSGAFVGLEGIVNARMGKGSIGFGAPLPVRPPSPSTQSEAYDSPSKTLVDPLKGLSTPDLQSYGLIPEFLGRLPLHTTLHPLSTAHLVRILTEPRNALLKQYTRLFEGYGCDLRFTKAAIEEVARKGAGRGGGARGLRGVLEEVLGEGMFEVPGSSVRYCLVTEAVVKGDEPARYYSRGQRPNFLNALEEENGRGDVEESDSVDVSEGRDGDEVDDRIRATG